MSSEHEERKRTERARARQQLGGMYVRREPQAAPAYCVCGAKVSSVREVLLCEHGESKR